MGFALYFFVPLRLLLAKQSPSTHRPKTERKNQMDVFANHPVQQQTQNMILSQQQLQSLKMLELTAQELEKFLQEEFTENPALEWKSSWRTGTAPAAEPLSYEASCPKSFRFSAILIRSILVHMICCSHTKFIVFNNST